MEFDEFKQIMNRYCKSKSSYKYITPEENSIQFTVMVGKERNIPQELNVFIDEPGPIIIMASPIGPCPADYANLLRVLLIESAMTISEPYFYMPEKGKIYLSRRLCFPLPLLTPEIIHLAFEQIPDQAYEARVILGLV